MMGDMSNIEFQFYDSPIKRADASLICTSRVGYFNSMIVRLKDPHKTPTEPVLTYFNSMIVRLKELLRPLNYATTFNFNSMIVRLKDQYPSFRVK